MSNIVIEKTITINDLPRFRGQSFLSYANFPTYY